ncbi:MAG: cell division protein ZapA [Acetanaerobacterium sp.]
MDHINTVKLSICGTDYYIATSEEPAYVSQLGEYINTLVERMMQQNPNLSMTKALLLCCMNTLDELNYVNTGTENLRTQIKDYLEDAARSRSEVDEMRKELNRLKKELSRYEQSAGYHNDT